MDRRRAVRSGAILTSCAALLGALWLSSRSAPATRPAPEPRAAYAAPPSVLRPVEAPTSRAAARTTLAAPSHDLDEPAPPTSAAAAELDPEAATEQEHYERFLLAADERPDDLEAAAGRILRGAGPAPEKVALLRVLRDLGSASAAAHYLLALRELPDVSGPHGESVPSTALLLLDRRAPEDALARDILRRAAFEPPLPPPSLRGRAAASFFLRATGEELLGCRDELAREPDPGFLEIALEALARNPNTEVAAILLAPHGRAPAEAVPDLWERP